MKRSLGALWRLRTAARERRVVLLYHAISDGRWSVSETCFRAQMDWLRTEGKLVSLDELLARKCTAPLQVAVTFDDGYANLHDKALPILKDGGTATVFVNTGWIGDGERKRADPTLGHYPDETFLLWREVEVLAGQGWTIGSHGVDHLDLTCVSGTICCQQAVASKACIEERLTADCQHFAYTWGRYTKALQTVVADAGYRYAFSGMHAPVTEVSHPFSMPRIAVPHEWALSDFKAAVQGDWDYMAWIQQRRARAG